MISSEKMKLKVIEFYEIIRKQQEDNEEMEKKISNREKVLIYKVKTLLGTETEQLDGMLENIIKKYD